MVCAATDFWEDASVAGFKEASKGASFVSGTGLIGRVWASQGKEVCANVQNLPADKYARLDAAKGKGLKGAVAVFKNGGVWEFYSTNELAEADGNKIADACP